MCKERRRARFGERVVYGSASNTHTQPSEIHFLDSGSPVVPMLRSNHMACFFVQTFLGICFVPFFIPFLLSVFLFTSFSCLSLVLSFFLAFFLPFLLPSFYPSLCPFQQISLARKPCWIAGGREGIVDHGIRPVTHSCVF